MNAPAVSDDRFFVDFTFAGRTLHTWLDEVPADPQELLETLAGIVHNVSGGLVGDPSLRIKVERDDRDHPCPECREGEVESVGRPEYETGHQPYACNRNCGYWG